MEVQDHVLQTEETYRKEPNDAKNRRSAQLVSHELETRIDVLSILEAADQTAAHTGKMQPCTPDDSGE